MTELIITKKYLQWFCFQISFFVRNDGYHVVFTHENLCVYPKPPMIFIITGLEFFFWT